MKKNYIIIASVLLSAVMMFGCAEKTSGDPVTTTVPASSDSVEETTAETETAETAATEETTTAAEEHNSYDDGLYEDAEPLFDDEEEDSGILSAPSDIGLYDTDGGNTNFCFTYGDEVFNAVYTSDNWKIIDSYKIDVYSDMVIICQALIDVYPVHGSDMESYRTADDMAYEWQQHNIAYAILPEDNAWRNNAKDVDLNPADQGKDLYELYKDRCGEDLI